ncbi:asparagine synthase (glutamine-hydrolyzing) [Rhodanobacter sp. K2T2]|uniref:asparagine synthase-related protein n=1 Tax=Rhodanobacter sp. K2T2 TaxID=2723085 RepID=UPI0015C6BBD4|nr:asparagine synthase C-terminal domain-containing protein [Rhodanobacter sp. K2T2]NYE30385.1 asparagine synthase (glutamine-hydrolyzing) [Rhodanobacter sp. K2T2]
MDSDYLAVLAPAAGLFDVAFPNLGDTLHTMGMRVRHASGSMTLFGTNDLPVLSLPGGGVLIGYLFGQDGMPISDSAKFSEHANPAQTRKHILETCWGSYLIIQPDAHAPEAFTITRAPSAAGNLPCIYSIQAGSGFLTSDISLAIRAGLYRKQIDWDFIAHRLTYPGIKTQRCGFVDLVELLPGCSLSVSGSEIAARQAWTPWDFVRPDQRYRHRREAADHIRHAVSIAVRAWTHADRSILLELSGGLDSSIVAACLRDSHARVICCNLTTSVPGVDERHYAHLMARQLDVELHTERLEIDRARFDFTPSPDSIAPGMGALQHAIDEIMESAAERHGADAYHSGGGGDSVFCYLRTAAPAADALRASGFRAAWAASRDLSKLHQCTLWKAGRLTIAKLRRPPTSPYHDDATFLAPSTANVSPEAHPWFTAPKHALPGDRERLFDLAGNQLFQGQASRGARRPLRFPLLSQPVMEACLRAPSWMWIADGKNRALARAAFSDVLPPDVMNRQSKATYMSYLGAVYEKNKHHIADFLLSGRLQSQRLLDARAIHDFVARPLPPRDQTFLRMFDLCMVENWVRHQP